MPLSISIRVRRRAPRALAVAVVSLLAIAGSASAADTTTKSRETCAAPQIEQPFTSFEDSRHYVLVPGGSFEDPTLAGWSLVGGAAVNAGNEPFNLRGSADANSLVLPAGASATTPTMCVDLNWPTMRMVGYQQGDKDAELDVEVLYPDAPGKAATWHKARTLKAKRKDGWHPSDDIKLSPDRGGKFAGGRPVALRFTSDSDHGSWRIDDIYVDPKRL